MCDITRGDKRTATARRAGRDGGRERVNVLTSSWWDAVMPVSISRARHARSRSVRSTCCRCTGVVLTSDKPGPPHQQERRVWYLYRPSIHKTRRRRVQNLSQDPPTAKHAEDVRPQTIVHTTPRFDGWYGIRKKAVPAQQQLTATGISVFTDILICFTASSSWVPEREGSSGTAETMVQRALSVGHGLELISWPLLVNRKELCLPGQKLLECWCVKEMGRERVVKREGWGGGAWMCVRRKKKQSSARLFSPRFFANFGI